MSHHVISGDDSFDVHDPRDAYTYLIRKCPNGMGAFGLEALNTMWKTQNRQQEVINDLLKALEKIAKWEFDIMGDCVADATKVARVAIKKARDAE